MVWYALRYRERLAGRSLTLPVFRAGVRGQLAMTLGCWPPGSGGGGGAVAAHSPSTCPTPRAPASCAGPVPVVPVQCVPVLPKPQVDTHTGRAYWMSSASGVPECWWLTAEPNGSARQSDPEALYKGARGDPQFKVTHG